MKEAAGQSTSGFFFLKSQLLLAVDDAAAGLMGGEDE